MSTVKVNGINIYYQKEGEGAPLILVHGNSESAKIFKAQIEFFKKYYTVYALDSRAQGKSGRDDKPLSYELFAEDVIAFMDVLKLDKADYIGFSDGAIIGIIAAFTEPERMGRMVLAGPNVSPLGNKRSTVSLIKLGYTVFKLIRNKNSAELMRLMLDQPNITTEQLNAIRSQALVIGGEKDMIKEEHLRYIANSIPECELVIFPKTNHFTYKHEDFNKLAFKFLKTKIL